MNILHVASEVAPFSQSGGLAQVAAALPAAISNGTSGIKAATLSPLYRSVSSKVAGLEATDIRFDVVLAGTRLRGTIATADATNFFVDCPALFDRDGLYQTGGTDYADNPIRFALLSKVAAVHGADLVGGHLDILHAHDWQAGLAPAYVRSGPGRGERTKTVFTIHNLAFQGIFAKDYVASLGLPWSMFSIDGFEFWDQINFLKGGAAFADAITTVSPSYAEEIKTEAFGYGLDGFFRRRSEKLHGILNGLDTEAWNPETDPQIAANYSVRDRRGKLICRRALREHFGLEIADDSLLCGVVSRFSVQKGPDLIAELVPRLAELGASLVVLGSGEKEIEARFTTLAEWFSHHMAVVVGFDEGLAHAIFAGCDALLMPSRYEPCGLAQLSAMRYGTIPVVSSVGGLRDSVDETTGFRFDDPDAGGLKWATRQASTRFRDKKAWEKMVTTAMSRDFSWHKSAAAYLDLYRRLLAEPTTSPSLRAQPARDRGS